MANLILRRGGSANGLRRGDNQSNSSGRIDPWNDIAVMDRVFDSFFRHPFYPLDRTAPVSGPSMSEPQIEVYENENELTAFLFAPGLDASTIDITAGSDQLTIKAERKPKLTVTDGTIAHTPWVALAAGSGSFSASYGLPVEVDPNQVTASYKDGVLEVHLSKSEAAKPKQVKVQVDQ